MNYFTRSITIIMLLAVPIFISCKLHPKVGPISGKTYYKNWNTRNYPDEYTKELRRHNYIQSHPELSEPNKERIRKGKICLGMSREDVKASWGEPHDINKTVGLWGVHAQWVYGYDKYYGTGTYGSRIFTPTSYLYFENGRLTSWQD